MRLFAHSVLFSSIILFGWTASAVSPASSSFTDLAKQVQTDQQSCKQPDNSYPADCIKKYSKDYRALYDAAAAVAGQSIHASSALAHIAQKQLAPYQKVKNYMDQNIVGLVNGTTTVPYDLLTATATASAGAAPAQPSVESGMRESAGQKGAAPTLKDPIPPPPRPKQTLREPLAEAMIKFAFA